MCVDGIDATSLHDDRCGALLVTLHTSHHGGFMTKPPTGELLNNQFHSATFHVSLTHWQGGTTPVQVFFARSLKSNGSLWLSLTMQLAKTELNKDSLWPVG